MCLYNAAAWPQRRERHLAVNAIVYGSAIVVERKHVAHHRATLRQLAIAAATVMVAAEAAAQQTDTPSLEAMRAA